MQGNVSNNSPSNEAILSNVTDTLAVRLQKQLYIDFDKWKRETNDETGIELARIFQVSVKELAQMKREEKTIWMCTPGVISF